MHIETEDGEEVELHPPSSPDENDRLKQSEDEDNRSVSGIVDKIGQICDLHSLGQPRGLLIMIK